MTTPNHGAQGVLLSVLIYPNWYHVIIALILSILPDASIIYQRYILGRKYPEGINWNDGWYNRWHYSKWAMLVPYANIHVIEDRGVHDEYGMNKYYLATEYRLWIYIVGTFIYIFFNHILKFMEWLWRNVL